MGTRLARECRQATGKKAALIPAQACEDTGKQPKDAAIIGPGRQPPNPASVGDARQDENNGEHGNESTAPNGALQERAQ